MTSKPDIIRNILASLKPGDAITARDIWDAMEPAEQGMFTGGVKDLSKRLGDQRSWGYVENGISEIVDGKTFLTWRLTKNAQKFLPPLALDVDDRQEPQQQGAASAVQTVDAADPATEAQIRQPSHLQETAQPKAAPGADPAGTEPLEDLVVEMASDLIDLQGVTVLNPANTVDAALLIIKQAVAQAEQHKAPQITRKAMKIKALKLIASSPLIQEDIAVFLGEIAEDLEKLPEAA